MDKRKEQIYESPQMRVLETKVRGVLCASPTSTEKYGSDMGGGEDLNF